MIQLNKIRLLILKLVFGLALIFYITWKIFQADFSDISLSDNFSTILLSFLLLIPINWGLETMKWRLLLNNTNRQLTFLRSFKLVLAGISTGIMTPNRIGNFVGRSFNPFILDRENSILSTLMGNLAQFTTTIFFGFLALYLMPQTIEIRQIVPLQGLSATVIILTLFIFLNPNNRPTSVLINLFSKEKGRVLEDFAKIHFFRKLNALGFAILRYIVITLQFFLVLKLFIGNLPVSILIGVGITFLLTTLIPSVAFGKLFVREASAVFVLGLFGVPVKIILASTFLLWFFNLAIPAVLGAYITVKND